MVPSYRFLGLLGLFSLVSAQDEPKDLGSVLGDRKELKTFYELIKKYPDVLLQLPNYDGITIVAPSNDAFENIPYTSLNEIWDEKDKDTTVSLLQYHILQGTVATSDLEEGPSVVRRSLLDDPAYTNVTSGQHVVINKAGDGVITLTTSMGTRCTLEKSDIPFQGGLVHIVDNLLIPPARLGITTEAFEVPSFLGGLYAAGLMPEVAERKNITVFAPQNEAFELVGGTLQDMDEEELARVMGYHIVPDRILVSSDLTNNTHLPTLNDESEGAGDLESHLTIRQAGNNKFVNSAQILQSDILIANGILHLISGVLNPDAPAVRPDGEAASQPPLFPTRSIEDPFTSELPCTVSCPVTSTPGSRDEATSTSSSVLETSTSDDLAARSTGHLAGMAMGVIGVGAGMVWL